MKETNWRPALNFLQDSISDLLKDVKHPRIGAAMSLFEEVGEIAKEVMAFEIYETSDSKNKIADEIADTFISLVELSECYDINIAESVSKKLGEIYQEKDNWRMNFEEIRRNKRGKLD